MKLFLTNLQSHWFSIDYGEGLDKGFFMSYICKREDTENTKPMDFKKIACTAIRRWNEKRHTDKTAGTRRTTLPETQKPQPAQGVPTAQPAPCLLYTSDASFIGTSSCKVLSALSGSRRFICVLVEHPINTYTLWKPVQSVGIIIPKKHYSNTTRSASTC